MPPPRPTTALIFAAAAGLLAARPAAGLADGNPPDGAAADAGRFADVRDNTLGVRPEEAGPYQELLEEVVAAEPAALRAEADAFAEARRAANGRRVPAFVDLFKHPDVYRGKPVTLTGHVRVLREFPGPAPAPGEPPETLVEAWLYTGDSQANPAVVVAAAAPGLPRGDDLLAPATVTGRFLKMYGYEAQDTTRVAPLLMAAMIDPLPVPEAGGAGPVVLGGAALVTLAGLSAGWWAWRTRPKRRRGVAATAGGELPAVAPVEEVDDDPGFVRFEEIDE